MSGTATDLTGHEFNGCVVLKKAGRTSYGSARWTCRCFCGSEFTVTGTEIRGGRKSCGCLSRPASQPYLYVAERDGTMAVIKDLRQNETIVDFQPSPQAWVCSSCGVLPLPTRSGKTPTLCPHVECSTRTLPVSTALEIMACITPKRSGGSLSTKVAGAAAAGSKANDMAQVAALEKTAASRAARLEARDEKFLAVTAPVTVRTMTEADREKLAAARAKKAKTFASPVGPVLS